MLVVDPKSWHNISCVNKVY